MKLLNSRAFVLALIVILALIVVPRVLRTNAAASAPPTAQPQYQYVSIVAISCLPTEPGPWDFCLYTSNGASTPMEQVLTTYSSQGYNLFSITGTAVNQGAVVLYTLRAPVTGAQK